MEEKKNRNDLPLVLSKWKWLVLLLIPIKICLFLYWTYINAPVELRYDKDRIFFGHKSGSKEQMDIWLREIEALKSMGNNNSVINAESNRDEVSYTISSDSKLLGSTLLEDSIDANGIVYLSFSVEVMPYFSLDFGNLVPDNYKEKYKGLIREFVFTFCLKGNRSINSKHRCRIYLDEDLPSIEEFSRYAFERISTSKQTKLLMTNSVSSDDYRFLIKVQKLSSTNFEILNEETFEISRNENSYILNQDGVETTISDVDNVNSDSNNEFLRGVVQTIEAPLNKQFSLGKKFLWEDQIVFNSSSDNLMDLSASEINAHIKYEAMSFEDKSKYVLIEADSMSSRYVFDPYGNILYFQSGHLEEKGTVLRVSCYKL